MEERGELFLEKISMSRTKVAKLCHTFIKDGAVSMEHNLILALYKEKVQWCIFFVFLPVSLRKSWLTPTPELSSGCWKKLQLRRNDSLSMWLNHSLMQLGEGAVYILYCSLTLKGHRLNNVLFFFIQATHGRSPEETQCSSNGGAGRSCGVDTDVNNIWF